MRLRPLLQVVRPLVRAIDWLPAALAVPLGVTLVALVSPGKDIDPLPAVLVLRLIALLMASTGGFALVDAMAQSTGAVPVARWARQWLRTLMISVLLAAGWGAAAAVASLRLADGPPLPVAGLAAEAAMCALCGLAGAAVAVRRVAGRPAALAGAATIGAAAVATLFLPGDLWPWPLPGAANWEAVHQGWLVAMAVPLVVLLAAHRDLRGGRAGLRSRREPAARTR
ncbi:hypothetical protein DP939_15020 [Spongiactinospora rosea]|uniref:ABC transporter n=1 Tax=Spongiactinospora rosea TaxID=2248750 RepID=A0A366LZ61_9ACTN|nr:hypothetical protein [Spongiactinospora rosea]RBQ19246.1 hypothetical protein DP939_15020 [Spongiactinospora rosea]